MVATKQANKYLPGLEGGVALPFEGRITTSTRDGAAVEIPAAHAHGEAHELRYRSLRTGQFQGLFVQVEGAGGAGSTVRGVEYVARQDSASAVGTLAGIHAQAQVRGTGNAAVARGVDAQVSMFNGYSGTLALGAALYGKFQTEGVITEGYGCLVENEFVVGGTVLNAAFAAKATGAAIGFNDGVDISGSQLLTRSADEVTLIRYRDSANTIRRLVDNGGVVAIVAD